MLDFINSIQYLQRKVSKKLFEGIVNFHAFALRENSEKNEKANYGWMDNLLTCFNSMRMFLESSTDFLLIFLTATKVPL